MHMPRYGSLELLNQLQRNFDCYEGGDEMRKEDFETNSK